MQASSACEPTRDGVSKGDPRGRPSSFARRSVPGGVVGVCGPTVLWALVFLWAGALLGCGPASRDAARGGGFGVEGFVGSAAPAPPHRGPVVLVTFSNLRSDAVGYLGGPSRTPQFDALARRAEFAGSAVAPSTSPPVSAASLILGVPPWQHQLLSHLVGKLRDDLPTLGSALGEVGYRSVIHYPVRQQMHAWGFFRGFDGAADLDPALDGVVEELRGLDGGPRLVWIHLRSTDLPWPQDDGGPAIALGLDDLYPYADPERQLPQTLRDAARRAYLGAVARTDRDLGRILQALDDSGRRSETLLVVTALHGLEFGEHGSALYGHNLGRESIQVPLLVDLPGAWASVPLSSLPAAQGASTDPRRRAPVELIRVWSTLVQATGGRRLPVHPPSLFEPAAGPALSSLYLANGVNLHSAVFPGDAREGARGPEQVVVTSRFAPDHPEFYAALLAQASLPAPGLRQSPRRVFDTLRREFLDARPWSTFDPATGEPTVTWRLEKWRRVRGTEDVDDAARGRERAAQAHAAWSRWLGPEETVREAF